MSSRYVKPAPWGVGTDQFSWFARMRREAPVFVDPGSGVVSAFRYEDTQRVLSDFASFSSERGSGGASEEQALSVSMISSDPPRHRRLRNLVTQVFTPRAVALLEPRISAIVADSLDQLDQRGAHDSAPVDFIDEFAVPLPVTVIAELLGVPAERRADFRRWSDILVTNGGARGWAKLAEAQREMAAFFGQMIAQRRAEPRDDLISHLVTAEIDGERLTQVELIGFCMLLMVAGNETTTNLLGNAVLCMEEQPEVWQRLRADPALIPSAIEEVLRYVSPVQSMFRVARGEERIGDVVIQPGQPVVAWIGSANRDETQFADADCFDITRAPNRHLAFGYGIHFCLGAPLARLEGRVALEALTRRAESIRVAPDARLDWIESTIVYGVKHLPVTLTLA
ncbi:MAG TPA: cytochrome P450 [Ktedonobacterales bacterium]|nr:cytochrome P450 [Ktedonobacterales bacterium]